MVEYRCDTPTNHILSSDPCARCEPIYNTLVVTPDGDRYRCSEPGNHHPSMRLSDSPCGFCREEEEKEEVEITDDDRQPVPPPPPKAEWSGAWAELTGYVQQARDDETEIDPSMLLDYLGELRRKALAPVREWMDATMKGTDAPQDAP